MRYRVGGATSTSAASAAATVQTMMNAQMWIMVYGRTREKSITTWAGSCTPQNTAEPSMAGVKNGRPAITSTIRNQSATAAAPIRPAMNPSRRIRVNCMSSNIGSLQGGASGLAPGVRTDDLVYAPHPRCPMTVARRLVFPLCLLVGSLLVIVAGTLHPDLVGDGAAQLTTIAQCRAWRAIHWTFLFSFPLALTGLVGLARVHAGNPGESAVRAGLIVGA